MRFGRNKIPVEVEDDKWGGKEKKRKSADERRDASKFRKTDHESHSSSVQSIGDTEKVFGRLVKLCGEERAREMEQEGRRLTRRWASRVVISREKGAKKKWNAHRNGSQASTDGKLGQCWDR